MHKIFFTPLAEEDLQNIYAYIARDNPFYAEDVTIEDPPFDRLLEGIPIDWYRTRAGYETHSGTTLSIQDRVQSTKRCYHRDTFHF